MRQDTQERYTLVVVYIIDREKFGSIFTPRNCSEKKKNRRTKHQDKNWLPRAHQCRRKPETLFRPQTGRLIAVKRKVPGYIFGQDIHKYKYINIQI